MNNILQPEHTTSAVIDQVSINLPPSDERVFKRVHAEIVAVIKARRQENLNAQFHLDPSYPAQHPEEAEARKNKFLNDKRGLNIGQCFELSISEEYLGEIDIVELDSTDHDTPGISRQMFDEMNDFVRWFRDNVAVYPIEKDGIASESYISDAVGDDTVSDASPYEDDPGSPADRLRSGRWMDYTFHGNPEDGVDGYRAIITRVRPFIMARAEVRGRLCDVAVYKETVVTIPAFQLVELLMFDKQRTASHLQYPAANIGREDVKHMSDITMHQIERMMYGRDGGVDRIHTAIFSSVIPVDHEV